MGLEEIRKEIDEIDSKFVELLVKRFAQAEKIAEYKKANGLLIRDMDREKEVVQKWKNIVLAKPIQFENKKNGK